MIRQFRIYYIFFSFSVYSRALARSAAAGP